MASQQLWEPAYQKQQWEATCENMRVMCLSWKPDDDEMKHMFGEETPAVPTTEYPEICFTKHATAYKVAIYQNRVAATEIQLAHEPVDVRDEYRRLITPPDVYPPPEFVQAAKKMLFPGCNLNGRSRSQTVKNISTNLAIKEAECTIEAQRQRAPKPAPPHCISMFCAHRDDDPSGLTECVWRAKKIRKRRLAKKKALRAAKAAANKEEGIEKEEIKKVPIAERLRLAAEENKKPRYVGPPRLPPCGTF